jgi:uncharacterized membrane protein YhaH (DUF805 family)
MREICTYGLKRRRARQLSALLTLLFQHPTQPRSVYMFIPDFLNEWGGYLGSVLGILFGVIVPNLLAYQRSRNTCGPKERACLWKVNVLTVPTVTVVLFGLALGLKYVVPPQYKHSPLIVAVLILLPYLWISTRMCDRRLATLRAEDVQENSP